MSCKCSQLPQLVKKSEDFSHLVEQLEKLETGNWVFLSRCRECKQYWRITESDGRSPEFAVKINDPAHWQEFDDLPLHKQLEIELRGGLTDEKCIWQGCTNRRVKGVVYCIDHLFPNGRT
jgi:hypothetical protein